VDYDALSLRAQLELAEYAERYKGNTLGIDRIDPLTDLWRPLLPMRDRYGLSQLHRRRIYGTDKVRNMTAARRRDDEQLRSGTKPGERMIREGGEPRTDTVAYPWYTFGLVKAKMLPIWPLPGGDDVRGQKLSRMLPFLTLSALASLPSSPP
jgi:hypothetical protein